MSGSASVSCVIPTYNEAQWIASVLALVADHPLVTEVIVVDDASEDGTADIVDHFAAKAPKISAIRHIENQGKSFSVATGIEASRQDFLLTLDGDLVGLRAQDLTDLIMPVTSGLAEASVSLIGDTPLFRRLIGVDYISGQRVMRRNLLAAHTKTLRTLPRFGLEAFINTLWLEQFSRIAIIRWPDVTNPPKRTKKGRGFLPELTMSHDILRVVPYHKILHQILALRARRIRL